MDNDSQSPASRTTALLEHGRQYSDVPQIEVESDAGNSGHIRVDAPSRPRMWKRGSTLAQSTRSVSEALRLAKSREEQETLLGVDEEADDDGCYPPRKNSEPRAPNPHSQLPVYATIHKIRRLVIASIGRLAPHAANTGVTVPSRLTSRQTTRTAPTSSRALG